MSAITEHCSLILRDPHGGVEDIAAMKAAGFTAIYCNILDFPPDEWDLIRSRAKALGVVCGPKARTADADNNWNPAIVEYLISTAESWEDSPFCVNTESEIKGTGAECTSFIASVCAGKDYYVSMEAIPFANVDWTPLADVPITPQLYVEAGITAVDDVKKLWHAYGIKCVVPCFGTHGGRHPSDYERIKPYICYTADDMGGNYAAWGPTGTGYNCKDEVEEIMEAIGSQHGIKGFMSWLRTQPNVPARGPKYDEKDMATWPWPDKLERTLNLLREGHDAE